VNDIRTIHPEDYAWKTDPFKHQREVFLRSRDMENFAYLMGMGTGKTKVTLDVAAWQYQNGEIDCLVVLAPNGVHRNWITREIPAHMPDFTNYYAVTWASYLRVKEQKQIDKLFKQDFKGLRIVALNLEAFLDDLSNWHIRRSRRRFWKGEHDADKEAAYETLYHVLLKLAKILAPILPFVTEVMYQNLVTGVRPDGYVPANPPESSRRQRPWCAACKS